MNIQHYDIPNVKHIARIDLGFGSLTAVKISSYGRVREWEPASIFSSAYGNISVEQARLLSVALGKIIAAASDYEERFLTGSAVEEPTP